jgi:MFS family permease
MADVQMGTCSGSLPAYPHPWMATGALLLALVSEGYDLQAANFAAPALVTSLGIAKADVGPLLSASLLGVLFGAALIGSLGDRLGRKRIIIGGCLAYGLLALAAAACTVLWQLVLLRFLIGLGLGGVLPNALALASDLARRGSEATAAGMIGIGITCGGMLAGLAAAALMPAYGWPSVFVVGGALPLVIVLLLWAVLPESPTYTLRRAQSKATEPWSPGPAALFRDGLAAQTVAIWVIFVAILLCVYHAERLDSAPAPPERLFYPVGGADRSGLPRRRRGGRRARQSNVEEARLGRGCRFRVLRPRYHGIFGVGADFDIRTGVGRRAGRLFRDRNAERHQRRRRRQL